MRYLRQLLVSALVAFSLVSSCVQAAGAARAVSVQHESGVSEPSRPALTKGIVHGLLWQVPITAAAVALMSFPPTAPLAGLPAAAGRALQVARAASVAMPCLLGRREGHLGPVSFLDVPVAEEAEEETVAAAEEAEGDKRTDADPSVEAAHEKSAEPVVDVGSAAQLASVDTAAADAVEERLAVNIAEAASTAISPTYPSSPAGNVDVHGAGAGAPRDTPGTGSMLDAKPSSPPSLGPAFGVSALLFLEISFVLSLIAVLRWWLKRSPPAGEATVSSTSGDIPAQGSTDHSRASRAPCRAGPASSSPATTPALLSSERLAGGIPAGAETLAPSPTATASGAAASAQTAAPATAYESASPAELLEEAQRTAKNSVRGVGAATGAPFAGTSQSTAGQASTGRKADDDGSNDGGVSDCRGAERPDESSKDIEGNAEGRKKKNKNKNKKHKSNNNKDKADGAGDATTSSEGDTSGGGVTAKQDRDVVARDGRAGVPPSGSGGEGAAGGGSSGGAVNGGSAAAKGSSTEKQQHAPKGVNEAKDGGEAAAAGADDVQGSSSPAPWTPPIDVNMRGLANTGSMCFLNTTIQLIRGLPILHRALLGFEGRNSAEPPQGKKMIWAVSKTLWALQEDDKAALVPELLNATFFDVLSGYRRGEQEDIGLVLGSVLQAIDEETRDPKTGSSLVDAVRGEVERTNTCGHCQRKTTSREACWTFQVTVPTAKGNPPTGGWPLVDLIKNGFRKTFMETPCEACVNKGRDGGKNEAIEAWTKIPPEPIMFFHRFKKTATHWGSLIQDEVQLPDTLDRAQLSGGRETGSLKAAAVGLHESHRGADSGHCTAAHRVVSGKSPTWMTLDDARVYEQTFCGSDSKPYRKWRKSLAVFAYTAVIPGEGEEEATTAVPGVGRPNTTTTAKKKGKKKGKKGKK
eukprot:g14736.t1